MPASDTKQEIRDLLEKIDQTYWGPEERAMIDQALSLSRQIGDEELEYAVRLRLTASAARTGDNDSVLSSFAWCLAKHDGDPQRFPSDIGNGMADLMWQFKWMIGELDAAPIFSLAQCEAMLDDMEAHYVKENLGLSGVITARFQHAWHTGAMDEATQLRTRLLATPRDEHSHCDACGRSELAGFAVEIGDEELALKLVDEIMEGGFTCGEEPEHALSRTLIAKLRAGRLEDALDSHMRSYRLARNNPDNISIVADNMVFCAITGNEARGLAMVERHLPWLAHDSLNEAGQLNMLIAIGTILEAVVRAGHGELVVRGAEAPTLVQFFGPVPGAPTQPDQPAVPRWTVARLVPAVWQAATRLAAAFDARNGNAYVSDKITKAKALLNEHYDLPIVTDVFLPPAAAGTVPTTAQQWLDLAEVLLQADLYDEAIEPAGRARDNGDARQRARALQLLMWCDLATDHPDEAERLLPARVQALRDEGRALQADVEERLGMAMFGGREADQAGRLEAELTRLAGQPGEELADVELTLAEALTAQAGDVDLDRVVALAESSVVHAATRPSLQASGLRWLWEIRAGQGDLNAAVPYADRILDLDAGDGCRAATLFGRARLMGGLERYDEGAANADAATAIYAMYQAGHALVRATVLASALLQDGGHRDEELARLRYALREAEQLEDPTTGIRYRLGRALVATGHPQEGVETLWEVLHEEEDAGAEPGDRADTAIALAEGFEYAEKYGNAVSMYQKTADLLQEAGQPVSAADALRRKGNILRGFEMYDEALEALSQAWDLVKDQDADPMKVQVLEAWAFAKGGAGDATAVTDMDHAIGIVQADPSGPYPWKIADLTDSKGRVLMDLDRRDEAVAAFLQAADGYAAAGDLAASARAEHFAAQNLAGPLERPADAVPIWHEALAHADAAGTGGTDVSGLRNSILVKLAEALDGLGQADEAAQVRAQLEDAPSD